MGRKNNKHFGFTLTELLVIVAIIALLAILGIGVYLRQVAKGNDSRRKGEMKRITVAVEEYEKDNNCYPKVIVCGDSPDQEIYPYLHNIPCDPVTHQSYAYEPGPPASCPSWYRVYSKLQNLGDTQIVGAIGPGSAYNFYMGSPGAPSPIVGSSTMPAPTSGGASTGYWGCIGGSCVPVQVSSPGNPVCHPTYTDPTCGNTNNCTVGVFPCVP